MADKKITDLTALASLSQDDLFVVVDNPSGTPITKKITVADMFSNVSYITSVSVPAATVFKSVLTGNANTTSASSVLTAGDFSVNALSTSANTPYQYGITVTSMLGQAAANVKTEHAVGKFKLDVSNAATLITNTFGLMVQVANTGTRAARPQAFLSLSEQLTGDNALSTKYLFVLNCANSTATTDRMLTNCAANVATHKIKVLINGVDYWLLAANNG